MKLLKAIGNAFAVGVLLLGSLALTLNPPSEEAVALDAAWEYVCEENRQFDCTGIEKPTLVFHDGVNRTLGAYGVYWPGESYIFVHKTTLDDAKRSQTVVHELVHYIEDQTGWQETGVGSCEWEAKAFDVADEYAIFIGRPDLVRGALWWKPYRQCQNYGG
jgi:hypothetical protein